MSAKLDNTRINRDINNYIQEIIQQLMEADGTFVELKLEVKGEVNTEAKAYAFRCFLLRLGFIGEEYKAERKILLSKLSGSSAFKSGKAKEAVICSE